MLARGLEDRAHARHRRAVDHHRALGEQQAARRLQHLHAALEPGALGHRADEVSGEVHGDEEPPDALLDVRAEQQQHVGERHQHAAVAHAHRVAVLLLAAEAEHEVLALEPAVERAVGFDERVARQAQRAKALGDRRVTHQDSSKFARGVRSARR